MKKIVKRIPQLRYAGQKQQEAYQAGFLDGLAQAKRWTSVKEEMPANDPSVSYLVRVSYQDRKITESKTAMPVKGSGEVVSIGHHDAFSGRWYILHTTLGDWEVTHWRSIDL
jgi:hypothetical protein